jgi:tetratricopeptide (TPR) repeat protein
LKYFIAIILFLITAIVNAQPANNYIEKGNNAYRQNDYTAAIESYKDALRKDPTNTVARFNLANALQKQNETGEARKNYDEVIEKSDVNSLRSGSNYNKGIAYLKEKDLLNAIASFKECLKQDPNDDSARENLQKALNELKKQQQKTQPQQQKQQQQKQKQQKNQPLNKDMMQQKFNELRNQEKQLQQKLQSKSTTNQPEKDW